MSECKYQKEVDQIIVQGDARALVEIAQKIAREMIERLRNGKIDEGKSVSTSQIRNIFGTSKRIEMSLNDENIADKYGELILLKPKMAYANGRFNKKLKNGGYKIPGLKIFVDCLSYAIDKIEGQQDRMKRFFNFFEAILAYHKAEGGK